LDSQYGTALIYAAANGNIDIVNELVNKGEEFINQGDHLNTTALIIAAGGGHLNIVDTLINHGAEIDKQDDLGHTALLSAAIHGHADIVNKLLDNGAEINKTDEDGNTALMLSVQTSNLQDEYEGNKFNAVKTLLEWGANAELKNNNGDDALSIAKKVGRADILDLLQKFHHGKGVAEISVKRNLPGGLAGSVLSYLPGFPKGDQPPPSKRQRSFGKRKHRRSLKRRTLRKKRRSRKRMI